MHQQPRRPSDRGGPHGALQPMRTQQSHQGLHASSPELPSSAMASQAAVLDPGCWSSTPPPVHVGAIAGPRHGELVLNVQFALHLEDVHGGVLQQALVQSEAVRSVRQPRSLEIPAARGLCS